MNFETIKLYAKSSAMLTALRNPKGAWLLLRRVLANFAEIGNEIGVGKNQFNLYINEIKYKKDFNEHIQKSVLQIENTFKNKSFISGAMPFDICMLVYSLIRSLKPSVVLETGVANGFSSAYILEALNRNNHGHLFSIDSPNVVTGNQYSDGIASKIRRCTIPQGKLPGWVIP